MNNKTLMTLISLASLLTVTPAFATDWKSLGDGWFVEKDSAKKYGDIGVVTIRFNDALGDASFDCKRRLALEPKAWVDNVPISDNGSVIAEIFRVACSKWYEVWKR